MKRLVTGAVITAVVVVAPVAASASWKASRSASGLGHTAQLQQPSLVTTGNPKAVCLSNNRILFVWTVGTTGAAAKAWSFTVDSSAQAVGAITGSGTTASPYQATTSNSFAAHAAHSVAVTGNLGSWTKSATGSVSC